jgi:hypothetical protein
MNVGTLPMDVMSGAKLSLPPGLANGENNVLPIPIGFLPAADSCGTYAAFLARTTGGDSLTGARIFLMPIPSALSLASEAFNDERLLVSERDLRNAFLKDVAARWEAYLYDLDASVDVDDISETVEAVLDAVSQFGLTSLSFSGLDAERVNGEHLAAMLRTTFTWRKQIEGWQEGLATASSALKLSGRDPDEVLLGLK